MLDGRSSTGASSRTLSVVWSVSALSDDGSLTDSTNASKILSSALAPFNESLLATISATHLVVGVDFVITMKVQSWLGDADEATVRLVRR